MQKVWYFRLKKLGSFGFGFLGDSVTSRGSHNDVLGPVIKNPRVNSSDFKKETSSGSQPFLHILPPYTKQNYRIYAETLSGAHFCKIRN